MQQPHGKNNRVNFRNRLMSSESIRVLSLNYYRASKKNLRHQTLWLALGMTEICSLRGTPQVANAAMAETIALQDRLPLVGQRGCNRIEVNSNCLKVVNTMQNGGNCLLAASHF
jgi:hypothetical protein